jgi:hypothetical protein
MSGSFDQKWGTQPTCNIKIQNIILVYPWTFTMKVVQIIQQNSCLSDPAKKNPASLDILKITDEKPGFFYVALNTGQNVGVHVCTCTHTLNVFPKILRPLYCIHTL